MILTRSVRFFAVLCATLSENGYYAFSPQSRSSRRDIIDVFTKATIGVSGFVVLPSSSQSGIANALDMDSFENSILKKDTTQCNPKLDPKCIPELTHDEALCKYGVAGATERTAACRRVRDAGGQLPNASKPGERSTMGWLNGDIALTK
jgi:hypothetical protein